MPIREKNVVFFGNSPTNPQESLSILEAWERNTYPVKTRYLHRQTSLLIDYLAKNREKAKLHSSYINNCARSRTTIVGSGWINL